MKIHFFHRWQQNRPLTVLDGFPPFFIPYELVVRNCFKCNKKQRWLPGYGGSEWGCWITIKED